MAMKIWNNVPDLVVAIICVAACLGISYLAAQGF
jgi:hypothetical protein